MLPGYKPYAEYALPLAQSGVPVAGGGEASVFSALSLRDADGKRITLWAILILGVALLAWMAWRLTSQMNRPAGVVETEAPPNDTAQKAPL